jgi:hypothetical protein
MCTADSFKKVLRLETDGAVPLSLVAKLSIMNSTIRAHAIMKVKDSLGSALLAACKVAT